MSKQHWISIAIASGLPLWCLGMVLGSWIVATNLWNQAIDRGYAIYHPQTGEFTWKCDLEKVSD